jgi:hypothetical protein
MAITSVTASPLGLTGGGSWLLEWASDTALDAEGQGPEFFVYRNGALFLQTRATSTSVVLSAGESPLFEVFDDEDDAPALGFPDFVELNWSPVDDVAHYRVEQLVDGLWEVRATVSAGTETAFSWRSARLEDSQNHQFQIVPVGTNGNEGTATGFTMLVVHSPDVPEWSLAYDQGAGQVTFDLV